MEMAKTKKKIVICNSCGKDILRAPSIISQQNFCNRDCYLALTRRKDSNEIVIKENYAELIIYFKNEKIISLIDIEDVASIKKYRWAYNHGYLQMCSKGKERLHRVITKCPKDKIIDHINRNTLDNRKQNLRICTQSINSKNISPIKNNSSGHRGISWFKNTSKWRVRITSDKKIYNLGCFKDLKTAIKIRESAEKEIWGERYGNI